MQHPLFGYLYSIIASAPLMIVYVYKISKKKLNLPHKGMNQCMNALADKVQKQKKCMYAYAWPHWDNVAMLQLECMHTCTSCFCILSASAFMH